jgi:hypothetical protein
MRRESRMLRGIYAGGEELLEADGLWRDRGSQEYSGCQRKENARNLMTLHLSLANQRPHGWQAAIMQDEHDGWSDEIDHSNDHSPVVRNDEHALLRMDRTSADHCGFSRLLSSKGPLSPAALLSYGQAPSKVAIVLPRVETAVETFPLRLDR